MEFDNEQYYWYCEQMAEAEAAAEAEKITTKQLAEDWAEFEAWLDEVGHFRELEAA